MNKKIKYLLLIGKVYKILKIITIYIENYYNIFIADKNHISQKFINLTNYPRMQIITWFTHGEQ